MRISVTGRAERFEPAQRGTVRVAIGFEGDTRAPVLEAATRVHGMLVTQAKAQVASGAATWWGAENVVTRVKEKWEPTGKGGQSHTVRVFEASARVTVKFADFAALAQWTGDIAGTEGVSITSVEWALTDRRRAAVIDEVRTAAVAEAAQRAGVYAAALGLTEVSPVAIYEDGLRPGVGSTPVPAPFALGARAAAADAAGSGDPVELRPADIGVAVTISADFDAS